ncbi:MAG: DUF1116 domain-containing protein [Microbacteriaceae bacterium]
MNSQTYPPVVLPEEVAVVNLGLPLFAQSVQDQAIPVQHVDWRIPANGDLALVAALEQVYGPMSEAIDTANAEVLRRLDGSVPMLVQIGSAQDLVPGVSGKLIMHCGPRIDWADVSDPLRRSMQAAVVAEGWAVDVDAAREILADGTVRLEPAYEHDMVVPMASAIGPSAPVFAINNEPGGTRAYAPINQGPGETPWFGRDTPAAIARLVLLRDVVGPMLRLALDASGPIDIFALAAQGVQMGDDVHMRTQACTALLIRHLLPQISALPDDGRVQLAQFLSGNHLFFLNLAMAAAKATALWADQVPGSSIVTMMCRNGTSYGVRLAGGSQVFTSPAPPVSNAMYYPDYGPETAAKDIGDSAILELVGLGGAAAAGSPAVAGFLGGKMADALAVTEEMATICEGRSSRFTLPTWNYSGTPLGVDARRVVEFNTTPKVTTGILHISSGVGQIGAGVATAPVECFQNALRDLVERLS